AEIRSGTRSWTVPFRGSAEPCFSCSFRSGPSLARGPTGFRRRCAFDLNDHIVEAPAFVLGPFAFHEVAREVQAQRLVRVRECEAEVVDAVAEEVVTERARACGPRARAAAGFGIVLKALVLGDFRVVRESCVDQGRSTPHLQAPSVRPVSRAAAVP